MSGAVAGRACLEEAERGGGRTNLEELFGGELLLDGVKLLVPFARVHLIVIGKVVHVLPVLCVTLEHIAAALVVALGPVLEVHGHSVREQLRKAHLLVAYILHRV